jgi:DNA-binding response OmpR family regulator
MSGYRVGIIEDDPLHRELASAMLEQAGFDVCAFGSTLEFRRHCGVGDIDLLLVDWELPNESGLAFLTALREDGEHALPVIFLTARTDEKHIVEALGAGADDFIAKPAKAGELVARVRSLLRRSAAADRSEAVLAAPPFEFQRAQRTLLMDAEPVHLTPREFDMALFFFQRIGRIVSREALLAQVWKVGPHVDTRAIDTYASRLRKRLGLDGSSGWRLEGIYQHGYRLMRVEDSARSLPEAAAELP